MHQRYNLVAFKDRGVKRKRRGEERRGRVNQW